MSKNNCVEKNIRLTNIFYLTFFGKNESAIAASLCSRPRISLASFIVIIPDSIDLVKNKNHTRLTKARGSWLGQAQNFGGVNMFMGSQPSPYTSSQCRKVNA